MKQPTDPTDNIGKRLHQICADLFPLPRANTGDGVRKTLRYLQQILPVEIHEVASGTPVFDWHVPPEYTIREAFIADQSGQRIVDFAVSNLQVLANSQPIREQFTFAELQANLLTLPPELNPDWVPYRTAFFREAWGFCVSQNQLARLKQNPQEKFEVVIDSEFFEGSLSYGEATIKGQSDETILVFAHVCHPSLANDNLSGISVAALVGEQLMKRIDKGDVPRKTYKLVFAPATIGAITWLSQNRNELGMIGGGLILSLLGDMGDFTFKQSRQTDAAVNRAAKLFFDRSAIKHQTRRFTPFGYDERQFCSPGINLPIGCLMRTPNLEFSEYHTSGDNLEFIKPKSLSDAWQVVTELLLMLEQNEIPINKLPNCEPQLGDRGIYKAFGQHDDRGRFQEAVMWVLNLSDGDHDLIEIANRSELPFTLVREATDVLREHGILT